MVSYLRLPTDAICVRVPTERRLEQTPQPMTKVCLTKGIKHVFMLNAADSTMSIKFKLLLNIKITTLYAVFRVKTLKLVICPAIKC